MPTCFRSSPPPHNEESPLAEVVGGQDAVSFPERSNCSRRRYCKAMKLSPFVALLLPSNSIAVAPIVVDSKSDVTYHGVARNGIEIFLGIPYGLDTGGPNRFKPPSPHVPRRGTTVNAQSYGSACPQPLGASSPPLGLTNVTHISEDCLNLDVARPSGTCGGAKLPVMVWIHGGKLASFVSTSEPY